MTKKLTVINFFGGPGSGKSTQAAHLFSNLKMKGVNVELVTEYAKDLTWQESNHVLKNQLYIFAKQHHRIWRLQNKVDIVVTDSPLIQNLVYAAHMGDTYKHLVMEETNQYNNINIFLNRPEVYKQYGRSQTLEQSKALDVMTMDLLTSNNIPIDFTVDVGNDDVSNKIMEFIINELQKSEEKPLTSLQDLLVDFIKSLPISFKDKRNNLFT